MPDLGEICDLTEDDFFGMLGELSEQFSNGEFGLYKGKNATAADSNYVINNGRYDRHKFNKVVEVNGKTSLPENWWNLVGPSPSANKSGVYGICHEIYGTDGTMFPPFVEKDVRLWIFVGELCRSIWLDYDTDIEVCKSFSDMVFIFFAFSFFAKNEKKTHSKKLSKLHFSENFNYWLVKIS